MTICPGRCNLHYRKATAADLHAPEPILGDPVWCQSCGRIIQQALRMLPLAYQALDAVVFMSREPGEFVSGSKNPPSPSPGGDAQDEMLRTVCGWEDDLRYWAKYNRGHEREWRIRRGAGRDRGSPLLTLDAACSYLAVNFSLMMEREECSKDFGTEILSLFTRAQGMVKTGSQRKRLPLPCPRCDMLTLVQEEGIALKPWYITCETRPGGCGSLYTPEEWEWWVEISRARAKL